MNKLNDILNKAEKLGLIPSEARHYEREACELVLRAFENEHKSAMVAFLAHAVAEGTLVASDLGGEAEERRTS